MINKIFADDLRHLAKLVIALLIGLLIGLLTMNVIGKSIAKDMVYLSYQAGIQHEKQRAQAFRDSIRNNCTYGDVIDTGRVDHSMVNDNFPKPNMKKMIGE